MSPLELELEPSTTRPTREQLLADFGEEYLSIQSLFRFSFVPSGRLNLLRELTLEEDWGSNNFVLLKYLAVHVRLSVEQGAYVWNGEQIVMTAGHLVTRTGAPIYIGLVRNQTPQENPWVMNWVGERPSCPDLPEPGKLGVWPELNLAGEIIVACDFVDGDRKARIPQLDEASPILQVSAVAGAVHWALHRGLAVKQIHGGGRGYFLPLYLTDREDICSAPDLVSPIVTQGERLIVRTLLEPQVAYSPARAVVERCEQLPNWLLDAWETSNENDGQESDAPGEEVSAAREFDRASAEENLGA